MRCNLIFFRLQRKYIKKPYQIIKILLLHSLSGGATTPDRDTLIEAVFVSNF